MPSPTDVRIISRDELAAKLERKDPFKLVMTLNEWAFKAKHIPGSLHFDSSEAMLKALGRDDDIVVYCTSPACHASIAAYHFLVDSGFTKVRRYEGGISDWEEGRLPLAGTWIEEASSSPPA